MQKRSSQPHINNNNNKKGNAAACIKKRACVCRKRHVAVSILFPSSRPGGNGNRAPPGHQKERYLHRCSGRFPGRWSISRPRWSISRPPWSISPKNIIVTKIIAPEFCAEYDDRQILSSNGNEFRCNFCG